MKDAADLHVERWRDHWVLDEDFDDDVEAMTVRMANINRYFRTTTKAALAEVGLQDFEYDTLHHLMIRDVPGQASPGQLAQEMGVSNAGITGRLDSMEAKGWLKRVPARVTGAGSRSRRPGPASRSGATPCTCAGRRRTSSRPCSRARSWRRSTGCSRR